MLDLLVALVVVLLLAELQVLEQVTKDLMVVQELNFGVLVVVEVLALLDRTAAFLGLEMVATVEMD
jgi:hypothetical protein